MLQEETECARTVQKKKKKCKDMLQHSGGQGWENEPVFEAFELYHVGNLSTEYCSDGQRFSHTPLEDKIVIISIILYYIILLSILSISILSMLSLFQNFVFLKEYSFLEAVSK